MLAQPVAAVGFHAGGRDGTHMDSVVANLGLGAVAMTARQTTARI